MKPKNGGQKLAVSFFAITSVGNQPKKAIAHAHTAAKRTIIGI